MARVHLGGYQAFAYRAAAGGGTLLNACLRNRIGNVSASKSVANGGPAGSRPPALSWGSAPCADETRRGSATLIPGATQPRVELILDSPLDDQPGAELGQLRQRLTRIITHPDGEQLIDPGFNLRRRRYGTVRLTA